MKHIIPAIAVLFCMATAAQADPCTLSRSAMLDLKSDGHGHATIPISINGDDVNFIVDTGGAVTAITSATADKLGLPRRPQNHSAEVIFGGAPITQFVVAQRFLIGDIHGYKVNLAVLPEGVLPGSDGLLGAGILGAYDDDFDFANGKFSFFSQQHCYGGVVYWTHGDFASVPIRFDEVHHVELDIAVDGKSVFAALDTGAPRSIMSLEYAEHTFGIDPNSPDLKALPEKENGGRHFYRYPFKSMAFGRVLVSNPDIYLIPDSESDALGGGRPEMLLGLSILSKLHLYIAYGEHNIYVTPADAH